MGCISSQKEIDLQEELVLFFQDSEKFSVEDFQNHVNSRSQAKLFDLMLGCMFGAALGDAIGTTVEFQQTVNQQEVQKCLLCPGQGPFKVAPGQVTDDTEMAYAITNALLQMMKFDIEYDINTQAKHYYLWKNSKPFDIGITIKNSFKYLNQIPVPEEDQRVDIKENPRNLIIAENMIKAAMEQQSLSNGCLMRLSPLAVYCLFLKNREDVVSIVKKDTSLTHYKILAQQICSFYCLLIRELIYQQGNRLDALNEILSYSKQNFTESQTIEEWVSLGYNDRMLQSKVENGFIKYAFTYTIYCLVHQLNFKDSMKEILRMGGDTDTNCAIAGAVIGACEGFNRLPQKKIAVLSFNPCDEQNFRKRPSYYDSKCFIQFSLELIKKHHEFEFTDLF